MTDNNYAMIAQSWQVARWPTLAWVETIIKPLAFLIGIVAMVNALPVGQFELPAGARLGQFIILFVLCLGLVAAIFNRIRWRDIVAKVFVIFNNLAHWGMLLPWRPSLDLVTCWSTSAL